MKKYLSVFGLIARSSIYQIIATLVCMTVAEAILFYSKLDSALRFYSMGFSMDRIEDIIDRSMINLLFPLCLIIITLSLCITGSEYSNTKISYTIRRLSISEREFFFCQATYNAFMYTLLWAVQAAVVFGLCSWYAATAPAEAVGNQTVFLAFYRNELLHSLMPISEISVWIRNIFLVVGLGFAAAEFPYKQRRRKNALTVVALALYAIVFFKLEIGNLFNSVIMILTSVCVIAETLYTVFSKDEEIINDETK